MTCPLLRAMSEQTYRLALFVTGRYQLVITRPRKPASPFHYFNSSPEVIRLVVMMYARFPRSLRNVEDRLFERGIYICYETVRHWWNEWWNKMEYLF